MTSSSDFIPVYEPFLNGNEQKYVMDCVETTWISSSGKYIEQFETAVAAYMSMDHAVAVFNGTVALHLALHCLDIGPGDEVLVPTFTYIASVNTIMTTGATPVFVESERGSWLMDMADARAKITPKTKAIMPVHLYGYACDMVAVRQLADEHGLAVVQDGAESLGVFIDGKHVGHEGDVTTLSFFGNKTITCGEGGMVLTNDAELAGKMRRAKHHGMSEAKRYWHDMVGFNYRMTNIQAAIGLAQIEQIDEIVRRKKQVQATYRDLLKDTSLEWQESAVGELDSSYWLNSALASSQSARDNIMSDLKQNNIDSRPVFFCAHTMPMYCDLPSAQGSSGNRYPIATNIAERGFSLPSYPGLTEEQVVRIAGIVKGALA